MAIRKNEVSTFINVDGINVSQIIGLLNQKRNIKSTTKKVYLLHVRTFLDSMNDQGILLNQITPHVIEDYLNSRKKVKWKMIMGKKQRIQNHEALSVQYKHSILSAISMMFHVIMKMDKQGNAYHLGSNPAKYVDLEKPGSAEQRGAVSPKDVRRVKRGLLSEVDSLNMEHAAIQRKIAARPDLAYKNELKQIRLNKIKVMRDYCMISILSTTGMRRISLSHMRFKFIMDYGDKKILRYVSKGDPEATIYRYIDTQTGETIKTDSNSSELLDTERYRLVSSKLGKGDPLMSTTKVRQVVIPEDEYIKIVELKEVIDAEHERRNTSDDKRTDYVFTSLSNKNFGARLDLQNISTAIKKISER